MLRILLKLDRMMSNIVGSTDCCMQECFCPLGSLHTVQVTSFVLRAAGCSMLLFPCSRAPDLIKRRQMECSALIYVYLSSLGHLRKKKKKVKRKGKSLETNFKILWTRVSLATTPERILQNTLLAVFSLSDSVLVWQSWAGRRWTLKAYIVLLWR